MDSKQFRVLILNAFLKGKNTVQAKAWLEKCYPDSAPSKTTIKRWFADFKRGRTDTDDTERPCRLNEVFIPENNEKNHENEHGQSQNLGPRDYWLFAELKKILRGKRFGSDEEVIFETEAYFEGKHGKIIRRNVHDFEFNYKFRKITTSFPQREMSECVVDDLSNDQFYSYRITKRILLGIADE
ncbi:uncharacterized protein [Lepeophtheirus salmonis]|uniref:uncharacterized protein n=1 Tax=Lepeophtheirus salmonis TaxID=72036 RepID=UPI003AF3E4D1